VNNKADKVISSLHTLCKLIKGGYADTSLDIIAIMLPPAKGKTIGACPFLPNGLSAEFRAIHEAHVKAILSSMEDSVVIKEAKKEKDDRESEFEESASTSTKRNQA